jgi:hypothetical protein
MVAHGQQPGCELEKPDFNATPVLVEMYTEVCCGWSLRPVFVLTRLD